MLDANRALMDLTGGKAQPGSRFADLFAAENGVDASLFSYNAKGACPVCGGRGEIRTEMAFLDPVVMPCEACRGVTPEAVIPSITAGVARRPRSAHGRKPVTVTYFLTSRNG